MKITDAQLAHLRQSFKQYDVNGDNQIDKHELIQVLHDLKIPNAKQEAEKVLDKLDANGDGSVSFGEFIKAVKALNNLKEVEVDDIVAEYTSNPAIAQTTQQQQISVAPIQQTFQAAIPEEEVAFGSPHVFHWNYEGSHVDLVGDFTGWGKKRIPLHREGDGHWYSEVRLGPGIYEYRFIIDNNYEWYYDILQPNVLNTGSGFINNFIIV